MAEATPGLALRSFEGAVWSAARNLLQVLISLVALALVARELGPQTYGLFGVAMLVIGIAEMIAGGALTDVIVQRKSLAEGHIDASFWLSTAVAVALAVGVMAFAQPLATWAGNVQAAEPLFALGALLPITVISRVPMALLARDLRFKAAAQIGALATIVSCGAGIVLALRGAGIWTLVVMEALRAGVLAIGSFSCVSWRPGLRARSQHVADLWRFVAGTLLTYSVGYADLLLPRLLVSHLLGTQALGIFMLAIRVSGELARLLTEPLRGVAMAASARAQDARAELQRLVSGLYRASRLLVFPVFLGMAALAPWLIPALFGSKWQAAVPAVQLLMLAGLPLASAAFNSAILLGTGHTSSSLALFATGCLLHLSLFPSLAAWGVSGAAVAMLGRQFGAWPLGIGLIRRATGLSPQRQLEGSGALLLAASLAAAIVWATASALQAYWSPGTLMPAAVVAGVAAYVLALRLFARDTLRVTTEVVGAFVRRDRAGLEAALTQRK